jgi:glutaredoxin
VSWNYDASDYKILNHWGNGMSECPASSNDKVCGNHVEDGAAMQTALVEISKQRTVPNIFIKGKHLGGCDG